MATMMIDDDDDADDSVFATHITTITMTMVTVMVVMKTVVVKMLVVFNACMIRSCYDPGGAYVNDDDHDDAGRCSFATKSYNS